ncbi:MAG: nuclear transport factor 2 family protein [Steroidobacteraceae bacterium]
MTELDRMLARDAIREVLACYARGIDRADGTLLKSCYFDDAIEEHGSSFTGRAHDYVDAAIPKVRTMGVMQHLLGNSYTELDGERAYVETYVWTFLRVERDGRSWDTFTGGRLHDKFERRKGCVEDRAPSHRVRLESRHAGERRLVPRIYRSARTGHAAWAQRRDGSDVREILGS